MKQALSKYYFLPILIILGLLGNVLNLEMFFGVNQIFGSIFVLLAVWYYGPKIGLVVALIVHSYTILLWGHPYALISFTLEAFVVGLLLRNRTQNIFIADFFYWIFIGIWLVPLFYGLILELPWTQVSLIMLKQMTNGILNALIATLIRLYILRNMDKDSFISFKEIIFTIMITVVSFSLYLSAIMLTKQNFKDIESSTISNLKDSGEYLEQDFKDFVQSYIQTPTTQDNTSVTENSNCKELPHLTFNDNQLLIFYFQEFQCIQKTIPSEELTKFFEKKTLLSKIDILVFKDRMKVFGSKEDVGLDSLIGEKRLIEANIYHLLPNIQMAKMVMWKKSHYIYEVNSEYLKGYNLVIAKSLAPLIDSLQKLYIFILFALLLIITISGVIIYFASKSILKPLKELGDNASGLPFKIMKDEKVIWPTTNIKEIMDLSEHFMQLTKTLKGIFKDNDERYENIFEISTEAIIVVEVKTKRIIKSNQVAKELFGEWRLDTNFIKEICSDADQILENKELQDIYSLHDKNGDLVVCQIEVQFFNLRDKYVALFTIKDISKKIELDEQLKLVSKVFETTHEGILITDAEQNIITVNQGYIEITGYEYEEAVGKTPVMLQSGYQDDHFYDDMWERIKTQDMWEGEIWNKKKGGEIYAQWLRIYKVLDQFGKVQNYIGLFLDITDRKNDQEKINQLAYYDNLTSLPNRSLFEDRIKHAITNAKRSKHSVALMFIDLDNFKMINDTLGHAAGDKLLQGVSKRIKDTIRDSDTLSRIGGDEFTLILENINEKADVTVIAEKIIKALQEPFILEGKENYTSASIGICLYPDDADNLSQMMQRADTAMYRVKEEGRNGYEFFDDSMNKDALYQMDIISGLKKALEENILELFYQAQVCFKSGRIIGAEALLRWKDQEQGYISPDLFIPIAEKYGLMHEIETFVLQQGAEQQKAWQEKGIDIKLSFNISDMQFQKVDFAKGVCTIFKDKGVDPQTICLELTERIVMEKEDSFKKIQYLKECGFFIALDDFGKGQSSLTYIKKYNIDIVKIDKSFIDDITKDEQSKSIIKAIISLANAMEMDTISEGIEDLEQLEFLSDLQCDTYQGWYHSKAMSPKEFEEFYESSRKELK